VWGGVEGWRWGRLGGAGVPGAGVSSQHPERVLGAGTPGSLLCWWDSVLSSG